MSYVGLTKDTKINTLDYVHIITVDGDVICQVSELDIDFILDSIIQNKEESLTKPGVSIEVDRNGNTTHIYTQQLGRIYNGARVLSHTIRVSKAYLATPVKFTLIDSE